MKKYHFIVLILLGMVFMPSDAIACGSGKKSCKKEMSKSKTEKKSCCSSNNSKEDGDKGCGGSCGHSKCTCSSTCPTTPLNLYSEVIFQNNTNNFSVIEKTQFSYTSPSISDGFCSIWLIPKIS